MHLKLFSSISGIYSLDVSSIPLVVTVAYSLPCSLFAWSSTFSVSSGFS